MIFLPENKGRIHVKIIHLRMSLVSVRKPLSFTVVPGGGGTPLYKLYRYVPPHRVGFIRRFGLKTGIHFAHLVWNRVWILRELRECMNVFIVSIPDE